MRLRFLVALYTLATVALARQGPRRVRQVTNLLTITWRTEGALYRSNSNFSCGPYGLTIEGLAPPFTVDAFAAPATNLTNQTAPLVAVAGNLTASPATLEWQPNLDIGQRFFMRVRDSAGNVALSTERWVEDGNGDTWMCDAIETSSPSSSSSSSESHGTWGQRHPWDTFFIVAICVCAALSLCAGYYDSKRKRALLDRPAGDVEMNGGVEARQVPEGADPQLEEQPQAAAAAANSAQQAAQVEDALPPAYEAATKGRA
ncbi:hypothetical protein JCM10213_004582 [Rhodosporidiobolus nylandii]